MKKKLGNWEDFNYYGVILGFSFTEGIDIVTLRVRPAPRLLECSLYSSLEWTNLIHPCTTAVSLHSIIYS